MGTVAVICVELMLPMASVLCVGPEFQWTWDPPEGSDVGRKLLPVIVRVTGALPAAALVGDIEETTGSGLPAGLMMNAMELESPFCPAPDAGLRVLTKAVPTLATRAAGTVAVTLSTLPAESVDTAVAMVFPFHCTTVLATNPWPVTVSVKSVLPALMVDGESTLIAAPVGF